MTGGFGTTHDTRPESDEASGLGRFARFLLVGAVGFGADAAALALLLGALPQVGPLPARLFSIAFAVCVTWALNRNVAFRPSSRGIAAEGARYGGVSAVSSLVNYGVYSAVLLAFPELSPLLALALGSAAAIALSFTGYSRLVFDC